MDMVCVAAEGVKESGVELLEEFGSDGKRRLVARCEPSPPVPVHQLVRKAVVAYLAAVALPDEVFEVCRDLFGVFRRVHVLREGGHGAGNGVERRPRLAEGQVIVVGEAVKLLP